jgi:nicotinamide-nucleotide amidase
LLKQKNLTLALAESVTCGMASHKLSNVKGISEVLKGGIVCYRPEVKNTLLGISKKMINQYTCESIEVTEALAKKLPGIISADIHVAVTGLASSDGSESKAKPVGSIFICVYYKNQIYKFKHVFKGTPLEIKNKACKALYQFVFTTIS